MEDHLVSTKKSTEPTLFVFADAKTDFEEKNNLHCSVLNISKIKASIVLTSTTFFVQGLPFGITIKRDNSDVKKKSKSDSLCIQIVVDKTIGRWSSKFSIRFEAASGYRFASFNKTYDQDLKHSQNVVSHVIDWEKVAKLKDFLFEIEISAHIPSGLDWPSRAATGYNGIQNEGATCYINSLLQSLFCTNDFRRIVYGIPVEPEDANDSFAFWLKYIFYSLQFGDTSDVRTVKMIQCFDWDDMNTTTQQDIQEFLRRLMDKLEQYVENTELKERLQALFVGQLQTTTICKNVNHKSSRNETFWDLGLPIDDDDDIFGAFRTYLSRLSITGYDYGNGKDDAIQELQFLSLPPVLYVQLKRFKYDPTANAVIKTNKPFTFYPKLDLRQYCADATYTLHSVLVHSGRANSGHYMAYVCPKLDGEWFKFNDAVVTKCSFDDAVTANYGSDTSPTNAYMLVYIKNSNASQILRDVDQADVVSEDLVKIEIQKELQETTDDDQNYDVVIFTPEKLQMRDAFKYNSPLMASADTGLIFKIARDKNLGALVDTLGEAFSLAEPIKSIALWMLDKNKERIRLCDIVSNLNTALSKIFDRDRMHFFAEISTELSPFDKSQQALMFIREYDTSEHEHENGKLRFFGHRYFKLEQTVQNVQAHIRETIGYEGDDENIVIFAERKSENQYRAVRADGNSRIRKIANKQSDTFSVHIIFELLDGYNQSKYLDAIDTKLMDQSDKKPTLPAPSMVNIVVKRDTNPSDELFSKEFNIECQLLRIVETIGELTNKPLDCIQLTDTENNVIEKACCVISIQEYMQQRYSERKMRTRSQMQKNEAIFGYKIIECDEQMAEVSESVLCNGSFEAEPMECDDEPSLVRTTPPLLEHNVITGIIVNFRDLNNLDKVNTIEFEKFDTMEQVQDTYKQILDVGVDKDILFLDSSKQHFDDRSLHDPLDKFLCKDETTYDVYYQVCIITAPNVSNATPKTPTTAEISIVFKNLEATNDEITVEFNKYTKISEILNEFAKRVGKKVNEIEFLRKHQDDTLEALESSSVPLSRYLDLDQVYLEIHFQTCQFAGRCSGTFTSITELKPKRNAKAKYTLHFKDRCEELQDFELEFSHGDKLSKAFNEIIEMSSSDKSSCHFYDSNGNKITEKSWNTTVPAFLKSNGSNISFNATNKMELRLQHIDAKGLRKNVLHFDIDEKTTVKDICKTHKSAAKVVKMKDGVMHSIVPPETKAVDLVSKSFEYRLIEWTPSPMIPENEQFWVCVRFVGEWPQGRDHPILLAVKNGDSLNALDCRLKYQLRTKIEFGTDYNLILPGENMQTDAEDTNQRIILKPDSPETILLVTAIYKFHPRSPTTFSYR